MHAIESLVEYSVKTVATASPVPPLARNICFSLYQLQNLLDCGYTVLRVKDELVALGYLFLLPPEQLPEPECKAAKKLAKKGGFLNKETYFDLRSGCCCVTAGSKLWKKLLDLGILPASAKTELRKLDPVELAELIIPLASKALAEGDKTAADTMGLWYAFFPLFCVVAGIDDSNAPAPERIQALLKQLAIPEVFKAAGVYGDDMDFEDGEGDEMTFLAGWATPFNEWRRESPDSLHPEACKQMVYDFIMKHEYVEADRYAAFLPDGPDCTRLMHRCLTTMACYNWLKAKNPEQPVTLPESILTLIQAKEGFEYMMDRFPPSEMRTICNMNLIKSHFLLGEITTAIDLQRAMFANVLPSINRIRNMNEKRIRQASLAVNYYRELNDNIPNDYPGKKELVLNSMPDLMDLFTTRDVLSEFLPLRPDMAEDLEECLSMAEQVIQQLEELGD